MQEGTPVLCKRCGGNAALEASATLRCPYCGSVEQLPTDEQTRLFEVRSRLRVAAAQVAQLNGTEGALGHIFEDRGAFFRIMGPFGFVLIVSVVFAVMNVVNAFAVVPASVPDAVRMQLAASALTGPMFMGGIAFSFPIALFVGRFMYARSVRPLLRARPPLYPGAPMRCRACGGPLALTRGAKGTCPYCNTINILGETLAQDAMRQLEEEAAQYKARANGVITGVSKAGISMTRVLVGCFVLTYVGIIGFMAFIQHVFS
jgi:LSD1 subclass zinc finger protein